MTGQKLDNELLGYSPISRFVDTIGSRYMLSDPSSSADCVEENPRRQSAESSDRLPLFCDEKETKRIVEQNQCPEYKASEPSDENRVAITSKDTSGTTGSGSKRASTRPGTFSGGTGATVRGAQTRTTMRQRQQDDDNDYPKPRKVPSMKATHQARSNKAYDLRYEYTRKGATIPSTMMDHLDNYNKPLFLRYWKGNRCFEYANDRVQPLIKQEMKRRRSSGGSYKSTKAPKREYRDSYAKRRGASSRSPSTDRRTTMRGSGYTTRDEECSRNPTTDCKTSTGTGYTTRGGSSPKTRGYTTGLGGSPSSARGSPDGGYATGQTSPQGTGTGCTPFKGSSPRTQRGITDRDSLPKSSKTPKPPRTSVRNSTTSSKSIYMPMWW